MNLYARGCILYILGVIHEEYKNDPCVRAGILFFEDIMTREAWCGGITEEPDANYMAQVARNQVDCFEGKLRNMKYLIHDNAMVFRGRFASVLSSASLG